MLELNRLYHEDCMRGMAEFPDGYFDLALVDPPYGIKIDEKMSKQKPRGGGGTKSGRSTRLYIAKGWDREIPPGEYFRELERVSRNQVIWGGNYFVEHLTAGHRGWLIWDKGQHGLTMSDAEIAYTSFDFPTRVCIMNRVAIQTDGAIHPAQKPVALYTWVLKTVGAKEGWRILDTHAGSAASLVACERFGGLYYVGFEIDEDYYIKASERLAAEQAQVKIFDMEEKQ